VRLRIFLAAILALTMAGKAAARQPAAPYPSTQPPRGVLVITGIEVSRPLGLSILGGFRDTLSELVPGTAVYLESPDLVRFSGEAHAQTIKDYLARRYRDRPIEAILAFDDNATKFLLDWDSPPWPRVPVVAAVTAADLAARVEARPGWTGSQVVFDFAKTIGVALALLPDTEYAALVSGRDPFVGEVRAALAESAGRVKVIDLSDLPLEDTRQRLSTLPPRTIVYYSGIWVDGAGQPFTPREALRRLAPSVNAPIFGYAETFVGYGIVGGVVASGAMIGSEFAKLVHRVISGTAPDAIPVRELRTNRPVFDGRELDRWGLSDSRLPPGSQVLFREPTLWQAHQAAVISTVIVVLSLLTFIAALLLEIQRRRRLQAELQQTSARLINAQEDERSRIARELHDDVSQRLALLALEGEMLRNDGTVTLKEEQTKRDSLITQARAIASDIHRISHELHPAILDQMGLVPALRHFAEDLARLHALIVCIDDSKWRLDVPREVELAFYRIVQEALQNVVRHSGAREAVVELVAAGESLTVSVRDRGRGFEAESPAGASLGLASMRERIRQFGGRLTVASTPGEGTTVRAEIDRGARRP
jgi:signal transduction histidine kinase